MKLKDFTLFCMRTNKIGPRLAVLKIFIILGYVVLTLFLFHEKIQVAPF